MKSYFKLSDPVIPIDNQPSLTPEERPKVHFPSYLETKISTSEAFILSLYLASFQHFSHKKMVSGNFQFFLLLKVMTILVKRMHVLLTLKV